MTDVERSLAYVRAALQALPSHLQSALAVPLPALAQPVRSVVTTGIGASEGPARMLAEGLAEAGILARFCPTSRFTEQPPSGELLVVFSQGLSPNARLTRTEQARFTQRWLVTSVDPASAALATQRELLRFQGNGFTPIVAPPESEPSTLIRLIGPCVATLMALRLVAHLSRDHALAARLQEAPQAYAPAASAPVLVQAQALALVTVGVSHEHAYGHRWKLLEALLCCDPPVWDVLQFAHGPLQTFHDKDLTLLILERGAGSPLVTRLESVLRKERHRVIHLTSVHRDQLSFFEHAAQLDALFLAALEAAPRNLFDWPARHGDEPLYGLGAP